MEVRGEKINIISSGPSKEITDLKKMKMMMMTPGSQDSLVCGNFCMKYLVALWAYV